MMSNVLLLMPHSGRQDPTLMLNLDGDQVGQLRIYGEVIIDGETMPDYSGALSAEEFHSGRLVSRSERCYFRGRTYGTKRERTPSLPANRM